LDAAGHARTIPETEHRLVKLACSRIAKADKKGKGKEEKEAKDGKIRNPQLIFIGQNLISEFVDRLERLRVESNMIKIEDKKQRPYDYWLDPRVAFKELVTDELESSGFADDEKLCKKIREKAWLIATVRLEELRKNQGDEPPEEAPPLEEGERGQAYAEFLVRRLWAFYDRGGEGEKDKQFKALMAKVRDDDEKEEEEKANPTRPKGMDKFYTDLRVPDQFDSVDIALFGRMTTSEAFANVEAAMQVAHAISTHEVTNETDYFTAMDDLGKGQAAAHVGEAQLASACFYKYFCLDWEQLVQNLAGPEPKAPSDGALKDELDAYEKATKRRQEAPKLAARTLWHFLRAAALTNPSGKQNSFAAHNLPDGILVEIKSESKIPTSYANAFADPVPPPPKGQRGESVRWVVKQSIAQLGQYVKDIEEGYGIPATRYWFSPNSRFPVTYMDRKEEKECEKEKPLIALKDKTKPDPERNLIALDDLVHRVVKEATGFDQKDLWPADKPCDPEPTHE
jgi:uncharacterized coiled-coil protein SlyX